MGDDDKLMELPPCQPCDQCGAADAGTWIKGYGCDRCRSPEAMALMSAVFLTGHEAGEDSARTSIAAWLKTHDAPMLAERVIAREDVTNG